MSDQPTGTRPPRERARTPGPRAPGQRREIMRNRLIESRLTPNAISLTGMAGNILAAVLVFERLFFLAGIAFILGSVMDTLDGRYSRMSGKGTPFGAFLDSTLDRMEEGIVLTAVARTSPRAATTSPSRRSSWRCCSRSWSATRGPGPRPSG